MQYYLQENMEQGRPDHNIQQHQDQQQPPLRQAKPPENQMAAQNHNNHHHQHHQPPPPPQKCPRCDSSNTKFCYYNNYSLSQPRYFCKACRRYWTQGGTLRNVPVGGGCRKSKRPKPLVPSSSADETARAQSSSAALQSQNLTGGLIPGGGQGFRALPPMMAPPSMGNTFYTGGSFLSSLAAMHSLQPGINQRATAVNLGGGGGNIQYDANSMAVLRAPAPPQYFQAQNDQFFPSTMAIPTRPPLGSWTQTFINRGAASSSAGNPSFWGGPTTAATENDNQASSSFNPNQWPDNNPGFDPPQ